MRVKVGYVKVEFNKLSEAFAEHEKAPLCFKGNEGFTVLTDINVLHEFNCDNGQLYRKVETEITWQDEVDSFVDESIIEGKMSSETFIKLCRVAINAYDNKE